MGAINLNKNTRNKFKKTIFVFLGLAALVLAYFGIIMPGVPAIPFILLSLFFLAKGSEKLHLWMLRQRLISKITEKINTKSGNMGFILFVISQLWVSIIVANYIFVSNIYYSILLILSGIGLSIVTYILMKK